MVRMQRAAQGAGQVMVELCVWEGGAGREVGQRRDDRGGFGQHRPVFGPGEDVEVFLVCMWSEDLLAGCPSFGQVAVPAQAAPLEGQISVDLDVQRLEGGVGVPPL